MSREIMQQSLKLLIAYQDCTMDSYITNKCGLTIQALKQELAKPEQAEPLSPVDIGVDVTPEGTHVVAFYNRPDAVQEMFYSQFHPLAKPEQEPEIVRRVRRYAGKRREAVGSPHINAKECIALANWIDSIFTAPPRKEWVGLTNDEINDFSAGCHLGKSVQSAICQAAAKLKEKNEH